MAKIMNGLRPAAKATGLALLLPLALLAGCGEDFSQDSGRDRYGWNWDASAEYKRAQAQQTAYNRPASSQPAQNSDSKVMILSGESPSVSRSEPAGRPAEQSSRKAAGPQKTEPQKTDPPKVVNPSANPDDQRAGPKPVIARTSPEPSSKPAQVNVQTRPVESMPASRPSEPPRTAPSATAPARPVEDDPAGRLKKVESALTDNLNRAGTMLEKASSAGEFDAAEEVIRDCFALLDKNKDLLGPEKHIIRRTELQELLAQAVNTRQSRLAKAPDPRPMPSAGPVPEQSPMKSAAADPPPAQTGPDGDEWQIKPQKPAPQSAPVGKPKVIMVDLPDEKVQPPGDSSDSVPAAGWQLPLASQNIRDDRTRLPPATRPAPEKPVTVIDGEEYILAPAAKSPKAD